MKTSAKLRLLFSLAWQISPAYLLMLLLSTLLSSGQILMNIILPKFLVDELVGAQALPRLLLYAGLIVGANALFTLLNNALKRYLDEKNVYMSEMLQYKMAEKIMNTAYAHLEMPHYLDLKERATFAIHNQDVLMNFVQELAKLLKSLVTLAGIAVLMMTFSAVLVAALLLMVAAGVAMYATIMRKQLTFMQEVIPINRRYGYYIKCCNDERLQKDIRLYGMQEMMISQVERYNKQINDEFMAMYRMQGRFLGAYGILSDLQAALAYGYVGLRVFTDTLGPRIGIGSFTMYVNAAINFTKASAELGTGIVTMLQLLGFLDPFMEFMTLPDEAAESGHEPLVGGIESIRFEGVSFSYPGSDTPVLRDVSFAIHQGEKISIVGLNGAGKTTLVKLLCRLYRPTAGTIYVNGRDIFTYDHAAYMRAVSAVFQDYKLFAFTVEENVTGGALGSDEAGARAMLGKVGLLPKLDALPDGIHTLLGKAYNEDGTEFSGGEQQKVAIARALYKDASLVILDEPTSALDPLAEAEIYENFNSLIGDKTALYISHRMSSSVFCDRILLLNGGCVEAFDTHTALMRRTDGLYYKLFMSQADNYRLPTAAAQTS